MLKFCSLQVMTLAVICSGSKEGPTCAFTDPNSSREVDRNVNVQLICATYPIPTPREFEWYKDMKQLPANATEENSDQSKSVLTIRNTSRSDSGVYKCVCSGENGSDPDGVVITLHVKVPPLITTKPRSQNLLLLKGDSSPFLQCEADGFPKPTITWHKNGKRIKCKWGTIYSCSKREPSSLKLISVEAKDAGRYRCDATNIYGTTSLEYKVRVPVSETNEPPRIPTEKKTYTRMGQNATLECNARNVLMEDTQFFWFFRNLSVGNRTSRKKYELEVKKGGEASLLESYLHVYDVTEGDYGRYSCSLLTSDNKSAHGFAELWPVTDNPVVARRNVNTSLEEVLLISIGCVTTAVVIGGILYRFYKRRRRLLKYAGYTDFKEYPYDVFVTYSGKDGKWITSELLPCLDDNKVRYCIHNRDFELGKSIMDNMAESVYKSRKVLAVVSKNYISSKFCRDELEMALYRSAEQGDSSVIVLRIDNVEHRKIPKSLRHKTYIDYADIREKSTWKKRLLKEVKPPPEKNNPKDSTVVTRQDPPAWKAQITGPVSFVRVCISV